MGVVRLGPLLGIPDVLRDLGADPAEVLGSAGIDAELLADPENLIEFAAVGRFLRLCVERTRCPHFGLLAGQKSGLPALGLIGFLAQHSPSVGAALRALVRHFPLHDRGAQVTLTVEGNLATVGYLIQEPGVEATDQIYDGCMAITLNVLRALCGAGWRPAEVLLPHRRPSDPGPFLRLFQAPVRFDAEQAALVFPATWLERPVPAADPGLHRVLEEQVQALEAQSPGDLINHVQNLLRAALPAGQHSLERVAELMSMHRRTLSRRLQSRGTTFQTLVEEVRFGVARQFLQDTDLPLSQVAATLGYSDVTAFTRAFRRWSGTSPGQWRRTRPARHASRNA